MLKLTKLLLIFIFFMSVCSCRHVYHRPPILVRNDWSVKDSNVSQGDNKDIPYLAWWEGYHDPVLNLLIKRGLIWNTSINKSRGHIEAAEGELKKVRMQWIPTVDILLGYSRDPATGFPGLLGLIIPSYIINIAHQIREQKVAQYTLAQARADDDAVKLLIISEIVASYFTYQAEVERNKLYMALARDLMQLADISKKEFVGGLISDIEQQDLYSQAKIIRGKQQVIAKNIVVTSNAIHYLVALNPGEMKTVKTFSQLNNSQLIPGALPVTVLENRPDMQVAENRLRVANKSISLASSNLLPTITLNLIDGQVAGNSRYIWPQENVYFNNQLLDMPIIKLSVLGDIAKARGLEKVSYFNYVDTLLKALRDTTNALAANERLTNQLQQTQSAKNHLQKAYDLNRRLYSRGIQNYVTVLQAKVNLDRINIKLNESKLQQLLSVVALYQELAGGYKAEINPEPETK